MSKRNFRKKVESSSEDEADGQQQMQRSQNHDEPKPQRSCSLSSISDNKNGGDDDKEIKGTISSKKKAVVLSFGDDEDEGDGVGLKKSKDSKAFKKRMRQAPGAVQVVAAAATASEPVGIGASGMYSAESLAELKRQQQFSTTAVSRALADGDVTSTVPEIELAGDDAVLVSEDGIKNQPTQFAAAMDIDHDAGLGRRVTFVDGDEFTSTSNDHKDFDGNFVVEDDEAQEANQDWENEVLRRAGQNFRPNRSSASTMNSLNLQELTISDTRESISQAMRSLKNSTTEGNTKALGLDRALIDAEHENNKLKAAVETASGELAALKEFREYCSDVVGMLRDKESFLLELQSTVAQTLMAQRDVAQKRRIEYQEKALAAMRHSGMLVSMGGYMPSKAFETYDINSTSSYISSNVSLASDGFLSLLQRDDSAISKFLETATRNTTEHEFMLGLDVCSRDFYNDHEVAEMKIKVANLQKAAEVLLSDARPEISDVSEVMRQFAEFRRRFPKKYASAFVPLSLPPLIGALVRFDVIVYPMLMENISFADRKWHAPIMEYSLQEVESMDAGYVKVPEDEELLPKVIQGAVYSWFLQLLDDCFSPLSRTQCIRTYDIIRQLLEYDLPVEKANAMLQKVVQKFEVTISTICIPVVRSEPDKEIQSFLARQMVLLLVCIENFLIFKSIVAPENSFSLAWVTVVPKALHAIHKVCEGASLSARVVSMGMTHKLVHLYICAKFIYSSCSMIRGSEKIFEIVDSPSFRLSQSTPVLDFSQLRSLVATLGPSCDAHILPSDTAVALCQASSSLLRALRVLMVSAAAENGSGPTAEESDNVETQLKYFMSTTRRLVS